MSIDEIEQLIALGQKYGLQSLSCGEVHVQYPEARFKSEPAVPSTLETIIARETSAKESQAKRQRQMIDTSDPLSDPSTFIGGLPTYRDYSE